MDNYHYAAVALSVAGCRMTAVLKIAVPEKFPAAQAAVPSDAWENGLRAAKRRATF
jgi:hypothetical protein